MKFVKALNQGIVTDLGIGGHVYNISMAGCEVEDSIAAKLKEVFGHLILVTEKDGTEAKLDAPVDNGGTQVPSEGAKPVHVMPQDELLKTNTEILQTALEENKDKKNVDMSDIKSGETQIEDSIADSTPKEKNSVGSFTEEGATDDELAPENKDVEVDITNENLV